MIELPVRALEPGGGCVLGFYGRFTIAYRQHSEEWTLFIAPSIHHLADKELNSSDPAPVPGRWVASVCADPIRKQAVRTK